MKRMPIAVVVAAFAALLTADACSSRAQEGTNTNWLMCAKDVDCASAGPDVTCISSICRTADGAAVAATGGKAAAAAGGSAGAGGKNDKPTDGGAAGGSGNAAAGLPACTWPSELDGDASSRATCHAARALVTCTIPGGGTGTMCTTDGTLACEGTNLGPCSDKCNADEYVASCGGPGPGAVPDAPAGCRFSGAVPAGIAFYCCPCGAS